MSTLIVEAIDRYLDRVAVFIQVGKAVQRSLNNYNNFYEQTKGNVGPLANAIGGRMLAIVFVLQSFPE